MTENPLSIGALGRLRRLAEGNNMRAEDVEFIGTEETTLHVKGEMHLKLDVTRAKNSYAGALKPGKSAAKVQKLTSEADVQARADDMLKNLQQSKSWAQEAVQTVKAQPGEGWGYHGSEVVLDGLAQVFYVQTPCATCNGTMKIACATCNGAGQVACTYCRSLGQEICPSCNGSGNNPTVQGQYCTICNGSTMIPCRQCRGTLRLSCPNCRGQGNSVCNMCGGNGQFTVEETVTPVARGAFHIIDSIELPSGFRRALSRGGAQFLARGHATITAGEMQLGEEAVITYQAVLPFAELRIKIKGKPMRASVLGLKGLILDVPPFIDTALLPIIEKLEKEADAAGTLARALEWSALRQAFELLQDGNGTPQQMRRFYPAGLSKQCAERILSLMQGLVKKQTAMIRMSAGGALLLALSMIYALLMISGIRAALAGATVPIAAWILDISVITGSYFAQEQVLRRAALWELRRNLKHAVTGNSLAVGTDVIGMTISGLAAVIYIGMQFVLGSPSWIQIFRHPFG
jgi:hypothetical protein